MVDAAFFKKGGGQQRPQCRVTYETIYSTQCSTTYTQQCATVYETKYETKYEQACSTTYEEVCKQTYRDVPDKQCSTIQEQECTNEQQTTYETTYRDECQSVPSQVFLNQLISKLSLPFLITPNINSLLLRCSTARGSNTGLNSVGPAKVKALKYIICIR